MTIRKRAVFCGVTLSLLVASLTPLLAGDCTTYNAQVDTINSDRKAYLAQQNRVDRIKPTPYTDAALCKAATKFWSDLEKLLGATMECKGPDDNSTSDLFNAMNTIIGANHCPSPW